MDWDRGFSTNSPEFLLLDGDMEEFRSEKTVKSGKSLEEIEKLMVDERLSEIERACLLISTGQDVQKFYVISRLPDLLKTHQMDTLCRVLPKVCVLLHSAPTELQVAASKSFSETIDQQLVAVHIFVTSFLPTVLMQLESKDTAISSAWLDTALTSIPHLPRDVIKRDILNIAVAKGQLSQTVSSRQASCLIIGRISPKFEPFWLKRELLPLATSLCQDVDLEVRRFMCQQLHHLARALGLELTKSTILKELIELTNDEECAVRTAAIETLTELLSFLDNTTLKTSIVPLVQGVCNQAMSTGDTSLPVVARLLGRLCHELKGVMTSEQCVWFIQFYRQLSQYKCEDAPTSTISLVQTSIGSNIEAECRRCCAYNFPAMLLFTGSSSFDADLSPILRRLVEDESDRIRRTIASGFHEVVKLLEEDRCLVVAPLYQSLLRDKSPEVLVGVASHLPDTMVGFARAANLTPDTRQPGLLEFIPPLLSCEQVSARCRQWRLHEEILKSFSCLVHCLTSDQLYSKFVPLMFKYITGSCVLPVKLAASRTLIIYIRHIRRAEQRLELCGKIIEECAKSPSCKHRLLFIDICYVFLEVFSGNFFKETFYETLLDLAYDPVINVRLRLSRILPDIKAILKLPRDRKLLQLLELTVRKLISQERDPDASEAIREAITELDRIEVAMETLSRCATYFEADLTDRQKEEEERQLVLAEERERESSNGGRKEKQSATIKGSVSPSTVKAQLGRKPTGKAMKQSPNVGRKTSTPSLSVSSSGGSSPGSNSPCIPHKSLTTTKPKGGTTPTSIRKTLSSPPATASPSLSERTAAAQERTSPGRLTPTGSSSPKAAKPPFFPSRQTSIDKKKPSPQSSPSANHTGKNKSSNPTVPTNLAVSKSKDSVMNSSAKGTLNTPRTSSAAPVLKQKAQQYGLTYASSKTGKKS